MVNPTGDTAAADEHLRRLADLIKCIEATIKKCQKKYRDRNEIDELYSNLTVRFSDSAID